MWSSGGREPWNNFVADRHGQFAQALSYRAEDNRRVVESRWPRRATEGAPRV